MRRKSVKSYLLIFGVLLILMSLSKGNAQKIRGTTIAMLGPCWNVLNDAKLATLAFLRPSSSSSGSPTHEGELQRYQLENQLLKAELSRLRERLGDHLNQLVELDSMLLPARVIFRSPATWDSSLWVNVGQATNVALGKEIVAKNSPVVLGQSVIGVIDYVGEKQSRVRLITDAGLTPSVRALRLQGKVSYRLAKGELHGCSQPQWRRDDYVLRGIGFNYDFADEAGPARDLRTGKPLDPASKAPTLPLIKVGDILVTAGLDGVFPPGLHVARVTKILPLKEGDYYYEIEAQPTVKNLDDLAVIFILPPVGFDSDWVPQDWAS